MINDIRQARIDLAAVCRWAARLGYQSGVCNHFSVTAPGRPDLFLVNAEGLFWSETTASSLLLCQFDGTIVEGEGTVEPTAFCIHAPIHRLKPDAAAVLHTHMPAATALCLLDDGRIEDVNQTALKFHDRIAYDEAYSGIALDVAEGERLAGVIGDRHILMMRNHGPLVVGRSIAEAFNRLYYLEEAAKVQLLAMSAGRPFRQIPVALAERAAANTALFQRYSENLLGAIKRVLDREEPDYAT